MTAPTLEHVPKKARDAWAGVLARAIDLVVASPTDLDAWTKLLMLPKCILYLPSPGHKGSTRDSVRAVKDRIKRWYNGEFIPLWTEVISAIQKRKRPMPDGEIRRSNSKRAKRLARIGRYGKAVEALGSAGLAPPSASTRDELLLKHPQSSSPSLPPSPLPDPFLISQGIVRSAIKSFPPGTSPGPSGLRASHLKESIWGPSPARSACALSSISSLVSLLCSGSAPPEVTPHLCGATLLAPRKKDGGVRPIAVGEVLRRLVSKCLSSVAAPLVSTILPPHQVGVGTPGGAEAIVHSLQLLRANPLISDSDKWVLLVDFRNAFNNIDRALMFEELRSHIPGISPWMEWCYGSQPHLIHGDYTIHSCAGVQQGDPLGPLGFSMALHPIVQRIVNEVPGLSLNAWYLDDGTLCGSLSNLKLALDIIEEDGPARGLLLNRNKSLLFAPPGDAPLFSEFPSDIPVARAGVSLLGSPVGSDDFCVTVVKGRLDTVRALLDRLPDIEDSQIEYSLLRSCLSLPKFISILRTCSPSIISSLTAEFDQMIYSSLSRILGACPSPWTWAKATLPVALGGLGLRQAQLHAPAAFLGAICSVRSLVDDMCHESFPPSYMSSAFSLLHSVVGHSNWSSFEDMDFIICQKTLSQAIDQFSYQSLLSSAPDDRSRALALASSVPHSGDWLQVLPSDVLHLQFFDLEFRLCLLYWLGIPMASSPHDCPVCERICDPMGDHAVGCGGNSDRIVRHNALCEVIFSSAQAAGLAPRKEVPALIPDSSSRPADIFLPSWSGGKPTAFDVTVISPLQQLTLSSSAASQGAALLVAESRKRAAYSSFCRSVGISFIPLAVEALGFWGKEALTTIKSLGRLQASRLGLDPKETTRHLFQKLSVALWRGNSHLWVTRFPIPPPQIDGII